MSLLHGREQSQQLAESPRSAQERGWWALAAQSARTAFHLGHRALPHGAPYSVDRKSTRLNSSHSQISYAVFLLKKTKWKSPSIYNTISPPPTLSQDRTSHAC